MGVGVGPAAAAVPSASDLRLIVIGAIGELAVGRIPDEVEFIHSDWIGVAQVYSRRSHELFASGPLLHPSLP